MDIKQRLKQEIQATLQPHVTPLTRDELRRLVFEPALAEIMALEARCEYQHGRADGFERRLREALAEIDALNDYEPGEM
jgi:hypothetical protein